jgi:hypothetical protein
MFGLVDHSNPSSPTPSCTAFEKNKPKLAYGGRAIDSTADYVAIGWILFYSYCPTAPPLPSCNAAFDSITFAADGPAALIATLPSPPPPTPPCNSGWKLGYLEQELGDLEVTVTFDPSSYFSNSQFTLMGGIRVGVRPDDLVVIGWIDPDLVPIPDPILTGVDPDLYVSLRQDGTATCGCWDISCGLRCGHVAAPDWQLESSHIGVNRVYLLRWYFHAGGNEPPPSDFRDPTDKYFAESEYEEFVQEQSTGYKLTSRLKVRKYNHYDLTHGGALVDVQTYQIGDTKTPCPTNCWWDPVCLFSSEVTEGQAGDLSGLYEAADKISLMVDGSPVSDAIILFNTITGMDDPSYGIVMGNKRYWENVGARTVVTLWDYDFYTKLQVFPTFHTYINGRHTDTVEQVLPYRNFNDNPHPFGGVDCTLCVWVSTQEGGRCGDAISLPEPGVHQPPYLNN